MADVMTDVSAAWLAELPRTVDHLVERWDLEVGDPFPGSSVGWVAPARRIGEPVVLKVQWPHPECEHEAAALSTWDGDEHGLINPAEDLEDQVIQRRLFKDAFERLNERDRELLRMIYWDGFTNKEAAASLGAPPLLTFRRVVLPTIAPGVVSGAIFAFVISFDEVVVALFLTGPAERTLPRQMFVGIRENISPVIAAAATLLILLSVLLMATTEILRRRSARLGLELVPPPADETRPPGERQPQPGHPALQRRHPLLEHVGGRVHDPGVDVSRHLEVEQVRAVLGVVEGVGDGLVDRHRHRAGGRVRGVAAVHGDGFGLPVGIAHGGLAGRVDRPR